MTRSLVTSYVWLRICFWATESVPLLTTPRHISSVLGVVTMRVSLVTLPSASSVRSIGSRQNLLTAQYNPFVLYVTEVIRLAAYCGYASTIGHLLLVICDPDL